MRKFSNKYRNIKVGSYDSKKEAKRAWELEMMLKAGKITDLKKQVKFNLLKTFKDNQGRTERGIDYIADFVYKENGCFVIEDVKSPITKKNSTYIIKRKLAKSIYNNYKFIET